MWHKTHYHIMPTWHCGGRKLAYQMCASLQDATDAFSHVLNQCPVSLHLRRYNTRHDAVLEVIKSSIMPLLSDADCLIADLHSHQPYIFPPSPHTSHITHTNLRPDLVLWNTNNLMVCLVELTICFETRFKETHSLKENKYADLVEKIRKAGVHSPTDHFGSRQQRPLPCNQV